MAAQDVSKLLGVSASRIGNRGEPVKEGVRTLLVRSYTLFAMEFPEDSNLNDMLPTLFQKLGGVHHLLKIREMVNPEFLEIHLDLPVRESEDSQDGYLSETVISDIFQLKASLSFGFF